MRPHDALEAVSAETARARKLYPKFNSAHEGYAVLLEEVEELWAEIRLNPAKRSAARTKKEATQVAAMALRFLIDCC